MTEQIMKDEIAKNLEDAGCSRKTIHNFMDSVKKSNIKDQMNILEDHRNFLLEKVHGEEKKIRYLDYLINQIRKDSEKERNGYE